MEIVMIERVTLRSSQKVSTANGYAAGGDILAPRADVAPN